MRENSLSLDEAEESRQDKYMGTETDKGEKEEGVKYMARIYGGRE
jgi:hypothetical protein